MKFRATEKHFYKVTLEGKKSSKDTWLKIFTIVNFMFSLAISVGIVTFYCELKKYFDTKEPSYFTKQAKIILIEVWT